MAGFIEFMTRPLSHTEKIPRDHVVTIDVVQRRQAVAGAGDDVVLRRLAEADGKAGRASIARA